ncbi:MAG TPA: uL22 family ribosomal protein [Dehalococcoidia bacterium]|nr:uL22 family ribosomal protein [Dehalococcoidia bacterium]
MKRGRPQARGRINPYQRRSCHVTVIVEGESGE